MAIETASDVKKRLRRYYDGIQQHIRFRTPPVGYKHLESKDDVPEGTYIPSEDPNSPMEPTNCTLAHLARHMETVVAAYRPHLSCAPGMRFNGMVDVAVKREGNKPAGAGIFLDDDPGVWQAAKSRFRALSADRFEAVVCAPLDKLSILPDLVMQWGTPAQINRLVKAYAYVTGKAPTYEGGGGVAEFCYSGIAAATLEGRPALVNDWEGRIFGLTQDDEMMLSIPIDCMDSIMTGLGKMKKFFMLKYPPSPGSMPIYDLRGRPVHAAGGPLSIAPNLSGVHQIGKVWSPMIEAIREKYATPRVKVDKRGRKIND